MLDKRKILRECNFVGSIDELIELEDYVQSKYKEHIDYVSYTQRGDDCWNGLEIYSKEMMEDEFLQKRLDEIIEK